MKDILLCLESQSDVFFSNENIGYIKQLLELLFGKNKIKVLNDYMYYH